jgi:hypothetical protein
LNHLHQTQSFGKVVSFTDQLQIGRAANRLRQGRAPTQVIINFERRLEHQT